MTTPKDPRQNLEDLGQSKSSRKRSGNGPCLGAEVSQGCHESALRQRAEELAALNALVRSVNATLSANEITVAALEGMLKAVCCDLAFLFLRDNERLVFKDVMPSKARQRLGMIPEHRVGECLCGLTALGGKPLFSRDLFADHRCTWEECKGAGLRSLATLPLSSGKEIIGVIGLASESERDFEQQAEFLEAMAGQVSVAFTNARLFEVAQRELAERKKAEEALRQALTRAEEGETLLAALMEYVPEGITICDESGNVRMVSRRGEELLGGQHAGKSVEEVVADWTVFDADGVTPMAAEDTPVVCAMRKGEVVQDVELVQKNADGRKMPLLCNAAPIRNADGHVVGGIVAWRDITERKAAEERVQKEQQETALANRILRAFVECEGDEMFDQVLAAVQEGMASQYGIFGYTPQPGHLTCPSLSKLLDACEVEGKCIHYPPEKWKGLWARALTEKRSFYTNEAPPVPGRHPIIHNNLAVPVLFHGEAIGLLNLANKEGGYRDEDQRTLEGIADRLAPVLYAWIQRKLRDDERMRSEEAIRASLREKEVLLKEIHHRVKNNMQVISSLVALQADGLQHEAMRAVLQDVTHRVRSMAMVHEKLYQSPDLARVDFADYAQSLLNYLWRAHVTEATGIRLALDLEPVSLSVDTAVPCGLILNELASNALKHAFRGGMGGEVAVSLRGEADGQVSLSVRDNGVGLPAGFEWRGANTLGLRLVQMLTGQLQAAVEVSGLGGTEFTITFERPSQHDHSHC